MVITWLPKNKIGAVCFSIDDVHPAKSSDYYEAGGDLNKGALGYLEKLLDNHKHLHSTLFITADWREISPIPTRKILASIPHICDHFYLSKIWPKGTMTLDKHPEFIRYLKNLPRTDFALHGLHHCHKGRNIPIEFQNQNYYDFKKILQECISNFNKAGLDFVPGICPPGWNAPVPLLKAMIDLNLLFIASARDIKTPITRNALTDMSGMKNVSLIYPQLIQDNKLIHITTNFQRTNPVERAIEIIENGGLVSIKAHIVKDACGLISKDGLDKEYTNYLDSLFTILEDRYKNSLWWTSMSDISKFIIQQNNAKLIKEVK
jgi:hypothetical protein